MAAVVYRFAAELRTRRRAWISVALLAGIFYGAVIAVLIGARRTDTVVARSLRNKFAPDVVMVPAYSVNGEALRFDTIARFPEVTRSVRIPNFLNTEGWDLYGYPDIGLVGESGRVLEGRLPHAGAVDEAAVNFVGREQRHVHVGDVVTVHLGAPGYSGEGELSPGPATALKIVGVTAELNDFASAAGPRLSVSAAFAHRYEEQASSYEVLVFRLKRGDADLAAFRRHINELTGGQPVLYFETRTDWAQIQRSFHVQATALRILAGFLALVSVLILTQTLARVAWVESADHHTLTALGMPKAGRSALNAMRGVYIGVIAAVIATLVGIWGSWPMPFGRPRLAETGRSLSMPIGYLAVAFAIVLIVVALQSTIPALAVRRRRRVGPSRSDRIASNLPGIAPGLGTRFALDGGRGADAIPVRSTLASASLGVLAVVMSLSFAANLTHLLATPRLYGWNWDATVDISQAGADGPARLEAIPGVAAVGYGMGSAHVDIGSVAAEVVTMDAGPVEPVLLEGRRPVADDEVALARKTLRAVHAKMGSLITFSIQGQGTERTMRVVGVAVLPVQTDLSTLGEGALVSEGGIRSFDPTLQVDTAYVRYKAGADVPATTRAIEDEMGGAQTVQLPTKPSTLVDFGRVRSLPFVLAGLLALLALGTIDHVLVSSVKRRRGELAVLKTVGLVSAQLRAVVVCQALTMILLSLLIGIPLGLAAGHWVWLAFATSNGFVPQGVAIVAPLVLVCAAALVFGAALAWMVGGAAGRTPPATILRSE